MKKSTMLHVAVGDFVLIGRAGITRPVDWILAEVLWADDRDVVTTHTEPSTHQPLRQVFPIGNVRAVGDLLPLYRFQQECAAKVREESRVVTEAESALGRARDSVWAKLDDITAAVPVLRNDEAESC
jgi:hypothetical protein